MNLLNKLNLDFSNWRRDLSGGLTAAIIALPMGLAFGVQSGLGAQAGLNTAIILAIVASLIAGTKTLISDPTGPMTVVAATIVGHAVAMHANSPNDAIPLIIITFAFAGVLQIAFSFFKIADYVRYMPSPVISGFMSGIGVIITSLQIFPLMGQSSPRGVINVFSNLDSGIMNLNWEALTLGGSTILIIYLIPLISKKIPSILFALIIVSGLSVFLDMNVPVIGTIPSGFPSFKGGVIASLQLSDLQFALIPALTLAALGTIDTLLTSVVADNLTKTHHNGNKELIGQGLGNTISALFGGIPGAGATMGTVTNINSGAKTNLSGISKGVFLLLIVVSLGTFVQYIPMAVLAGILITIGIGILDLRGLSILLKVPRSDAFIQILVLTVTVFDNLLDAVGVGMIFAAVLFMKRMSDVVSNSNKTGTIDQLINYRLPDHISKRVYLKKLDGPLFFGFADQFKKHSESIASDYEIVVIDMKRVPFLDQSGILTLEEVIRMFESRNTEVFLVGANDEILEHLSKLEIIPDLIPKRECFSKMGTCVDYIEKHYPEIYKTHHPDDTNIYLAGA